MQKIQFSKFINAPREKVWNTMLDDATYREWTKTFHEGSYYKGEWKEGSKMLFLGPDEAGGEGGMVSEIKEVRPYEFVSIQHMGLVKNGVEDTTSEEAQKWSGVFENYTFNEKDGGTEVVVDLDVLDEYKEVFEKMWIDALESLKNLAEK